MIALIESGSYSDYGVDVIRVEEPWQAYAWAHIQERFGWGDGHAVMCVIEGTVVCGRGTGADMDPDDIDLDSIGIWDKDETVNYGAAGTKRDFDVRDVEMSRERVEPAVGEPWDRVRPTKDGMWTMLRRARIAIEAECAAKGKPVPWEVRG